MKDHKGSVRSRTDELIAALEREQTTARDLNRRHTEHVRRSHGLDRQVFIERRRRPR